MWIASSIIIFARIIKAMKIQRDERWTWRKMALYPLPSNPNSSSASEVAFSMISTKAVKNPLDLRPYPRLNTPNSFFWEKWRNDGFDLGYLKHVNPN